MIRSVIIGTGCCIPELVIGNKAFENNQFFETDGSKMNKNNKAIIEKFQSITGISERRYARPDQNASDLAYIAAQEAINDSGIDAETLDYIIVAHNFGDVHAHSNRITTVPSLAAKVKALLKITNPDCVAYDLPFGCPGWVEGMIQANYFIRSGDAQRCLIIGSETLSRVIDEHDRDSMLYSDGSGAVILEASKNEDKGILSHKSQTHAYESTLLHMDKSYSLYTSNKENMYLKMSGHKVYEFALNCVPQVIKSAIDKANIRIEDIAKVLVHQANEKMDFAILERLFKLYNRSSIPNGIMPMTIGWLGNSSVATVPTLLDLILKGKLKDQNINPGENVVFASVGAGMNINAIVYRF